MEGVHVEDDEDYIPNVKDKKTHKTLNDREISTSNIEYKEESTIMSIMKTISVFISTHRTNPPINKVKSYSPEQYKKEFKKGSLLPYIKKK